MAGLAGLAGWLGWLGWGKELDFDFCPMKPSPRDRLEIWMPLGIGLLSDLLKFLIQKWRQLGIKIDLKSMISSKDDFLKKPNFSIRKTMISMVQV